MQNGKRQILRLMGMDDGPNPEQGWAERIDNLAIDAQGVWHNCVDFKNIYYECQNSTPPAGTVDYQSIYWWAQRGTARQWIVWERATSDTACALEVFDGINQTYQTLGTGRVRVRTPYAGTTYLPINGYLYIINGYDQPVRWNGRWPNSGSELQQIGFTEAPPPLQVKLGPKNQGSITGMADSGVGVINATFRYGYAITYVNELGNESPPSETVWISATNTNTAENRYHVTLRWGPTPRNVQAVRLYRTVNLTGVTITEGDRFSLYHVGDFPAGGIVQVWSDGLVDTLLGHQLDTTQTGLFPRGARYAALFKGTMFLAGAPSYPDRVFYSAAGFIEQYPAANVFDFGTGAGGEITGLHATQNALVVFRRKGVYLIKGDPVSGFYAQTVAEDGAGCVAPGAIVDDPVSQGVLFLSESGPMMLKGSLEQGGRKETSVEPLFDKIRRFWQMEVDKSALIGARAVRFDRDQEVLFFLPANRSRSTINQQVLVYHYAHGFWSLRDLGQTAVTSQEVRCCARVDDHRGIVLLGAGAVYVPFGRLINSSDKSTERMVWRYRMGWWGERLNRTSLAQVEVIGSLSSTHTYDPAGVALRYQTDRKTDLPMVQYYDDWSDLAFTEVRPALGSALQEVIESEYSVDTWEASLWDTGYWLRPTHRVYPFGVNGGGYEHQIELLGGGVDVGPVELVALGLWVVGGPEQAKHDQLGGSARP